MQAEVIEEILIPPDMPPMCYNDHWPWSEWQIAGGSCDCLQPLLAQRRLSTVLGQAGIPDDCKHFSFTDFSDVQYKEPLQWTQAFVASDALLNADGKERTGILLWGSPGIGKTTLGSLVFRARVEKGQAGVWLKFVDLVAKVRATYQEEYAGPSVEVLRQAVQYAPFLMIDDLGSLTRGDTYAEDMIEFMFLVFDHRWAKRMPTLVTTNLTEPQLVKQFGEPVVSRLCGLCHTVRMQGTDIRRAPVAAGGWRGAER